MKKVYVVPDFQEVKPVAGCMLTSSGDTTTRYSFYCPHIPETKCNLYDEFIKKVQRKTGLSNEHFLAENALTCPYKNDCEEYNLFCKIMNGRQY